MSVHSRVSLSSLLPRRSSSSPDRAVAVTRGMRALNESADEDLPIETPRDDWKLVECDDASYLQRSFDVTPAQAKMLVCDVIDAQEHLGHEVRVVIEGNRVTIRTTTHEFGEPTERDRQITRHIDTSYDEMRQVYR